MNLPETTFALVKKQEGISIVPFDGLDQPEMDKRIKKLFSEYGISNVVVAKPLYVKVNVAVTIEP